MCHILGAMLKVSDIRSHDQGVWY